MRTEALLTHESLIQDVLEENGGQANPVFLHTEVWKRAAALGIWSHGEFVAAVWSKFDVDEKRVVHLREVKAKV